MAKTNLEKLFDKQIKQDRKAQQKREQEQRKEATRQQAACVVNGQPLVCGMRIMDDAAEEVLKAILEVYSGNEDRSVRGDMSVFPSAYQASLSFEFEKLKMYGMLSSHYIWITGSWEAVLAPQGISYFEIKEQAMKRYEEEQKMQPIGNITNYGNMVFGNVSGSTLSVDNSIHEIERMIDEQGGEDAAELHELLDEVKELIENMQTSRSIPKQKKLHQRLSDHFAKHGWFYGAVIQLLGTAAITMLGAG